MQSLLTILLIGGATMAALGAEAQVTGVVTSTTGTVIAGDGLTISPPVVFSGDQIDEHEGNFDTGFGVTIAATSRVQPGLVEFQNGSGTSGRYTFLNTETDVNITFTNNTPFAQLPVLNSQIIAAGFGLFVGGECLTTQTPCSQLTGPNTFQSFTQYAQSGAPGNTLIGGTSVQFQILSGARSLYDLTASTALVYDSATNSNIFVDDTAQAQAQLSGFQLQTPVGSQTAHGYNWGTTDLALPLPKVAGQGGSETVTYRTITTSYSRTDCVAFTACLIGYSAFGDPIGMSGGTDSEDLSALAFAAPDIGGINGLTFETFEFAYPTYVNGVLTYVLAGVPEPGPWGLMLIGFGLAGLSARRRRAATSAKDRRLAEVVTL